MTQIIFTNTVGSGIQIVMSNFEDVVVAQGVTVGSTDSQAIAGTGGGHHLAINGGVYGGTVGVQAGTDPTIDTLNELTVGTTGNINGLSLYGVSFLSNASFVRNYGEISGGLAGVLIDGNGLGQSRIFNAGTIDSSQIAVDRFQSDEAFKLVNTGLINGGVYAFFADGTGANTVVNRGQMIGTVYLGEANDSYDGRGGTVDGTIMGGGGDDTFIAGQSAESFDGGSGIDTLDFARQSGVILSLNNDVIGSGTAAGDSYLGIENVIGSRFGNDGITGNAAANVLNGMGGVDTLDGQAGADQLIGGDGADVLTGGKGNDVFIYANAGQGGDLISDFHNVAGDNDGFRIVASGFGAGLVAGALVAGQFVTRADNVAQDSNDQFIFDTVDRTLWFDADGNGSGAAVMLADLQALALVTIGDILII